MAAFTKAEVLTEIKNDLRITDETIWTDARLNRYIEKVVREITLREPKLCRRAFPLIQYSKDLDISAITNWVSLIRVEYRANQYPPQYQQLTTTLINQPNSLSNNNYHH